MAYLEDQTATTLSSVLDQISDFAVANAGFTALTDLAITGANTDMRRIVKDGMYYYFYGDTSTLFTEGSQVHMKMMRVEPTTSNYLSTSIVNAQRYQTRMSLWGNPLGSYSGLNMYTDGNAVHVVLEVYDNVFAHMSFGVVDKLATWDGGEYLMGNSVVYWTAGNGYVFGSSTSRLYDSVLFDGNWSTSNGATVSQNYLYRPIPSGASGDYQDYPTIGDDANAVATQNAYSTGYGTSGTVSMYTPLFLVSPNDTSLRTMLIPIYMCMNLEGTKGTSFHLQGHIPSAKYLNIRDLDPKEIVDVKWKVYPYCSKFGDPFSAPVSGNYGIAYDRS